MLIKPSIMKMPNAAYPLATAPRGCTSGTYYSPDGSEICTDGFRCKPFSGNFNDCVDTSYCGAGLKATVGVVVVELFVGAIIS